MKKLLILIMAVLTMVAVTNSAQAGDYNHYRGHGHYGGIPGANLIPVVVAGVGMLTIERMTRPRVEVVQQYVLPVGYQPPAMQVAPLPVVYGQGDMDWIRFRIAPPAECARFTSEEQMYACYTGWRDVHPNQVANAYYAGRNGQ